MRTILLLFFFLMTGCYTQPPDLIEARIHEAQRASVKVIDSNGICSGFHIGSGYYITAAHCLEGGTKKITIFYGKNPHRATVLFKSPEKDVAVFESVVLPARLKISTPDELVNPVGRAIITAGFPGYMATEFAFQSSRILRSTKDSTGRKILISSNAAYPGESGGPVISITSGKVMGVVDAMIERVYWPDAQAKEHVHNNISIFVSSAEVRKMLEAAHVRLSDLN